MRIIYTKKFPLAEGDGDDDCKITGELHSNKNPCLGSLETGFYDPDNIEEREKIFRLEMIK
jgi:hypothetical protein